MRVKKIIFLATCVLAIQADDPICEGPRFDAANYVGNYFDMNPDIVVLRENIRTIPSENVTVTIIALNAYSENFNLVRFNDSWIVNLIKELSNEDLDQTLLVFALVATDTNTNATDESTLLITLPLPLERPKFTNTYYSASYKVNPDGADLLQMNETIDITVASLLNRNVTIDPYSSPYADKFEILPQPNVTTSFNVALLENLDGSVLTEEVAIVLTLIVSANSGEDRAALVIKLPKLVSSAATNDDETNISGTDIISGVTSVVIEDKHHENLRPKTTKDSESAEATFSFDRPSYTANYSLVTQYVVMDNDIVLTGDYSQVDVHLEGDFANLFQQNRDKEMVFIRIMNPLDSAIIEKEVSIILDVVATTTSEKSTTTLVINLPKKALVGTFDFVDATYTADYKIEDDVPSLEVQKDILLEGSFDNLSVSLSGQYANYFKVTHSKDRVKVTAAYLLDSSVIDKVAVISLLIVATKDEETEKATLVLNLPNQHLDECNSSLIIAVAVLGVLLLAALVGSAVFYYLKFKWLRRSDD